VRDSSNSATSRISWPRLPYGIPAPGGDARAVTARPKVLLLDDPVAGMNHDEADISGS